MPFALRAQPVDEVIYMPDTVVTVLLEDDPVIASIDALAKLPWIANSTFTTDTGHHNVHGFAADVVPEWPKEKVRERVVDLDAETPFDLTYNDVVDSYINLYVTRKREMSSRMLGLSELYFPIFEEALDRHNMPLELKYLAVVESALNPSVHSRAGAAGLWQFMLPTGRSYGMNVTSYVDERHDVYKSTEAACLYLKHLYGMYDDWSMALAAYNCGPGNVNKAIRRSGGSRDYWSIYGHLPRETRGYVPAFIAVNYLFEHHADHNLYPVEPAYRAFDVDTVQVDYALDLRSVAAVTGVDTNALLALNPMLKLGVVPASAKETTVYLPTAAAGIYVANEEDFRKRTIVAPPISEPTAIVVANTAPAGITKNRYHTVRRGESLGVIANKYRISVSQLKSMNGIRGTMIKAGQKLVVGKHTETASVITGSKATEVPTKNMAYTYHTVQPGDTLWDIANMYPGTSVDDLKRLNSTAVSRGLKPGQKIKIKAQGT
ncbi:MAG: LysM peptidoglycan-binding domain-containing protein [Flavobacteriales bacterium]|nr:LysM peptidoglycan-binding domain-containing protein [Flavobacteriales bacterium]